MDDEVSKLYLSRKEVGLTLESNWNENFAVYADKYPEDASEFTRRINGELPVNWEEKWNAAMPVYSSEVHCMLRTLHFV